jgi:hypothetical protein
MPNPTFRILEIKGVTSFSSLLEWLIKILPSWLMFDYMLLYFKFRKKLAIPQPHQRL